MDENETAGPRAAVLDGRDATERLSADDQATLREAQFLAAALRKQREAAAVPRTPGRCGYCGERCLPLAVYCDEECRADHERELAVLRRQGRAR